MPEEKARPSRARATGGAGKEPATKAKATKSKTAETKAGGKTVRTRKPKTVPVPEAVAVEAYLLWERGEPGDATAHWLRAEQELATA